jgi:hypothetical protein
MKGMVFLPYGLPAFLARSGPKALGGRDEKDVVGIMSVRYGRQVGHPLMSTGVQTSPLCKHNSGRHRDVIFLL